MKESIKAVRKALDLSQKEMAEILGIPSTAISKYENGEINPTVKLLTKLGDRLNVNLHWLLTGKGDMLLTSKDKTPQQEDLNLMPEIREIIDKLKQTTEEITDKAINLNKLIYTPPLQTTPAVREEKAAYTTPIIPPAPPWAQGTQTADDYEATNYPLIDGLVACGTPSALTDDQIIDHIPLPSCFNVQADFVIKTRGESMLEYGIAPGMLIFVRKQSTVEHGNLVLLAVHEADTAQPILKKVKQRSNGAIVFINGKNETMAPGDNMEVIGVVTFWMQDFRDKIE